MPTWGELGDELPKIAAELEKQSQPEGSPFDVLRRKYLKKLYDQTGRATFIYYSGWMDKPQAGPQILSVAGSDVAGFMEACSNAAGKDTKKLDLVLHSPGGDGDAAEAIFKYLRQQFDDIRVIVPLQAMSAATMMALSADEIVMGAHSQLGPIDPQLTVQTPEGTQQASAQAIKDQFDLAQKECAADPRVIPAWMPILRGLVPGLLGTCDHAAKRAEEIVSTAMAKYMLQGDSDASKKAAEAASWFGDAQTLLSHSRPVHRDEAREHHVKVANLEEDQSFQDAVLSVHHAVMHTLASTPAAKVIENENGRAYILMAQQLQLQIPGPGQQPPGPGQPGPGSQDKGPKKPPPPPRKRNKKRR